MLVKYEFHIIINNLWITVFTDFHRLIFALSHGLDQLDQGKLRKSVR